ncbi:MAG: choice-of-anchor Q domain-containing protein [Roseiflexaceae bacterium]
MRSTGRSQAILAYIAVVGLATALLGLPALPAHAIEPVLQAVVQTCTESGLRNALQSGGTITFNCGSSPVTITVTSPLVISKSGTVLDGGNTITLSGNDQSAVLSIAPGVTAIIQNLTIRDGRDTSTDPMIQYAGLGVGKNANVTVDSVLFEDNDGTPGGTERGGGGISGSEGSVVTVRNSSFINNRGVNGGAINMLLSSVTVENSIFQGNQAPTPTDAVPDGYIAGFGGAIYVDGANPKSNGVAGFVTIRGSTFTGNSAYDQGGAILFNGYEGDKLTIDTSTFTDNQAGSPSKSGVGGALRHGNGPFTISNSTFANNTSYGNGGAIFAAGTSQGGELINVTLVGNRTEQSPSGRTSQGGALAITQGNYRIINATIADNWSYQNSAAILAGPEVVTVHNTIFANNQSNASDYTEVCSPRGKIQGANNLQWPDLSSVYADCTSGTTFANPQLQPLAANGGPTPTMALASGSPAINAGSAANCAETDQRFADRVGTCDIGAFEYGSSAPTGDVPAVPSFEPLNHNGSPITTVRWGRVSRTTYYEVEVTQTAPSLAAAQKQQTSNLFLGVVLQEGSHQLTVRACNSAGCSEPSAPLILDVTSSPIQIMLPQIVR